ncbi:plasmid fertility inhibition factor family protein [Sphingomonas sanguinis]|uniref:ParB/Sulfiredoxin domain-containing protein n=1 Tax=Sphingomonas sanguinis TaxID=33051 RepID=A0A147J6W4_9SPHN|nr:hypothetical protein [Sphingomonas sanguinis]KTW10416.1 hypothetical protein NS258_12675 [Sphingomonas sanguinis]
MTGDIGSAEIPWRQAFPHPEWNDPGDAVVWIDVLAFDAAWRETDQWISPGGKTGAQDRRYRLIGEWIAAGNVVNMCEIAIDEDGVSFTNGRHRFAWLRDRGVRAMPVQVAPESAASFEARFGTPLRLSRFPTADRAVE